MPESQIKKRLLGKSSISRQIFNIIKNYIVRTGK